MVVAGGGGGGSTNGWWWWWRWRVLENQKCAAILMLDSFSFSNPGGTSLPPYSTAVSSYSWWRWKRDQELMQMVFGSN